MAFNKADWSSLPGKAELKLNKESGEILSRRQYDKLRRAANPEKYHGAITNEKVRSQNNPILGLTQKELVEQYRATYKRDYGKQISPGEASTRLKGLRKKLTSKDPFVRAAAYLQLSDKRTRADYYEQLRSA